MVKMTVGNWADRSAPRSAAMKAVHLAESMVHQKAGYLVTAWADMTAATLAQLWAD